MNCFNCFCSPWIVISIKSTKLKDLFGSVYPPAVLRIMHENNDLILNLTEGKQSHIVLLLYDKGFNSIPSRDALSMTPCYYYFADVIIKFKLNFRLQFKDHWQTNFALIIFLPLVEWKHLTKKRTSSQKRNSAYFVNNFKLVATCVSVWKLIFD